MKLMTYNIYHGAIKTRPQVTAIIKSENPDFLTINEANNFADDDYQILKRFAQDTGFPYFKMAFGKSIFGKNTAAFSQLPFKKISIIQPLGRTYIQAVLETPLGALAITCVHLSPISEDERLQEIDKILKAQSTYPYRVIMGDMNALARSDKYRPEIVNIFNEKQLSKFTDHNKFCRYEVIDQVLSADYFDPAVQLKNNAASTVPTAANEDLAHAGVPLRLDYILLSNSLLPYLKNYSVIKNQLTDEASDHYPVVLELNM
jgi:exodeoxyribonuclease-3